MLVSWDYKNLLGKIFTAKGTAIHHDLLLCFFIYYVDVQKMCTQIKKIS